MRTPFGTLFATSKTPFSSSPKTSNWRDVWNWIVSSLFYKNTVISGFLRGRPLPCFAGKGESSLLTGRFVGFTSICVVGVRYSLTEVARKVVLL
jgi:hypothetical protein